jgi:Zinc dependent phospholipase C
MKIWPRFCVVSILLFAGVPAFSYSVLSHEALVDALWEVRIRPILLDRFPGSTPEQLRTAHAYAYGGSIIQDMGYYPYGSKFFSDLTHYVRSGDFVANLIADSKDLNDYAFALGALSHYASDDYGHRITTNRAVPLLYPKLQRKFGNVVTYEDDPLAHLRTEFSFDVLELSRGHFAPAAYHDMIGFEVAKPLLEQAFRDTYSIELSSVVEHLDRALGSYRHAVSKTIPNATKIAWAQRKDEIEQSAPGITRRRFLYNVSRSSYEKEWGRDYDRPGVGARILAFLLKLIPKIGPLKALAFHMPSPEVEKMFMQGFNEAVSDYRTILNQADRRTLKLVNTNFDTGLPVKPATYKLADKTQARFLHMLAQNQFANVSPGVKAEILNYYSDLKLPFYTKQDPKEWEELVSELQELKTAPTTSPAKEPTPAS